MAHIYDALKSAAQRRAAYHRTVRELQSMRIDTALDLDIHKADAHRIAKAAIYG